MPGILLRQIAKQFGTTQVLRDVSMEVRDGEFLAILGPSGCGKSTLLRIIAGLETADQGSVFIGDRQVDALPAKSRDLAMVFQSYALYPYMTVAANIALPFWPANAWYASPAGFDFTGCSGHCSALGA
jgi:multiple sugar transport system ATP-binding protein